MIQDDALNKDKILQHLNEKYGTNKFPYCKDIAVELDIGRTSIITYCQEMHDAGYVRYNANLQGGDVKLNDSGIHFLDRGGFTREFHELNNRLLDQELDKRDQRKTNKVLRRTSRWALFISVLALLISLLAILLA